MNNHTAAQCDLILPLDLATKEAVFETLDKVGNSLNWVKIGLQLFLRYGPSLVDEIAKRDYKIFLDLKLHDIPNTVASAIKSLKGLPVHMLTIHTCGGAEMMKWASDAQQEALPETILLGVTVLTSMNQEALNGVGVESPIEDQVKRLGQLATSNGVQGLVCSPLELGLLRETLGNEPMLVTPGIRPAGSAVNDQKRIMTPAKAAQAGSSYIVVGRPILKADSPQAAIQSIMAELHSV